MPSHPPLPSRGTAMEPANRFDRLHLEREPEDPFDPSETATVLYRDASRSILSENDSPDIGFRFSVNPYRGCEHGCVYCYARPSHEYLGFNAGIDFESKLLVKENAPELLRKHLYSPRWEPQVIALSGNTDCYQPVERRLGITRRCLEVLTDFRDPVGVITKNALVTRDVDLLAKLASYQAAHVWVSVTTLDPELARRMEPRASTPERRLAAVRDLAAAGIPVGVIMAPTVPGLNDSEGPAIIAAAAAAGARSATWTLLRLAPPLDEVFADWLAHQYPERRQRVLHLIRECRGGQMNDSRFGARMRGEGRYAEQIGALFRASARREGLDGLLPPLSVADFRPPPRAGDQLGLF